MWRKLILSLVVVPLGVVVVALAVVNRKPVELILNPFGSAEPGLSLQAPLFLLLLGGFALGLVAGGIATWLGQGKWRRTAREEARDARQWRRQADRLEKEIEGVRPSTHRLQLPAD
ncbi:MAG: lipopolysaccharide assembly protein LapA domain-containing protein [Methyloceanibacter sp.]|nr:lipopolysaccharide assembly protein LapA domain-containing protein [Methyloceanibacter sp.]